MRKVDRRYLIEFVPPMLGYVLIMLFAWPWVLRIESLPLRALAALLPVVPVIFVVRAIVRRIIGGDELERRIALESLAIAASLVGVCSFAIGFLVIARVVTVGADCLILILPALFLAYGLARVWRGRRYAAP